MKPYGLLFFLSVLSVTFIMLLSGSGCANIVPPTGGPRDTLPPILVQAKPENYSVHFGLIPGKIILQFDEYLDLKDLHQNLIVSPVPKMEPYIESKLKTITIRIKDTLEPNTTYSIDFGKAIRDINEGNILKNYTYVFSTGPYIDTAEYSGKVILASSGKADSTLTVMLHRKIDDDSVVAKKRPRYITHVANDGSFIFHFLEPGTYSIFALQDDNGTHKYLSKAQLFAFSDSPIVVRENYTPVTLYAFADTSGLKKPAKKTTTSATSKKTIKEKEREKRLVVHLNISQGQVDLLGHLEFQFQTPLKYFDSSKVRFTDEKFNDIKQYHFVMDSTHKLITLLYNWPSDTKYHIIAAKDFAEDTLGNQLLKIDTISFQTKKESDYGSLRLRFLHLDLAKNPVLQFIQNDAIVKTYVFANSRTFFAKLFVPGEYEMRILYDKNKNGIWDPGDYWTHKQPELVQPIKKKLTVKGNWDNEGDITL
jgi:Bacterial Ig-like domain